MSAKNKLNNLNIRLLNNQDTDLWKSLRLYALQNSPESFGSSYEEEMNYTKDDWKKGLRNSDVFGAFIDGTLVGNAGFFSLNSLKTKHRGVLWGMFTKPEYRGKGIANDLISAVITHAKSRVIQLHLTCVTSNLGALKLYEKYVFTIYGTETRALKIGNNFFDEHLMILNLTN